MNVSIGGSISHVQETIQKHIVPRAHRNFSSDAWTKSSHNLAPKSCQMLLQVNLCLRGVWFTARNMGLRGVAGRLQKIPSNLQLFWRNFVNAIAGSVEMEIWSFWGLVGWFSPARNIFKCSLNHKKKLMQFSMEWRRLCLPSSDPLAPYQMAFDFGFVFQTFALKWNARFGLVLVEFGFFVCLGVLCGGGKNSFDFLCDLFLHSCCSHSVHIALDWNEYVSLDNNNQGNFYSWLQVTSFRSAF